MTSIRNNGVYGPTERGHYYKPHPHHVRNASPRKGKSLWRLKENEEYIVFKVADEPYWFCNENHCLFSLIKDCEQVLGKDGERLAKFPLPTNNDPWHGYPVFCEEIQNIPSDELLDILEEKKIISRITKSRIERKQI